jgi:predicted MFS family arabinose efflux permease
MVGIVGLICTASALVCTLAPSPDAPDKVAAVVKIIVASAVLIGAGAGAYLISRRNISAVGAEA